MMVVPGIRFQQAHVSLSLLEMLYTIARACLRNFRVGRLTALALTPKPSQFLSCNTPHTTLKQGDFSSSSPSKLHWWERPIPFPPYLLYPLTLLAISSTRPGTDPSTLSLLGLSFIIPYSGLQPPSTSANVPLDWRGSKEGGMRGSWKAWVGGRVLFPKVRLGPVELSYHNSASNIAPFHLIPEQSCFKGF